MNTWYILSFQIVQTNMITYNNFVCFVQISIIFAKEYGFFFLMIIIKVLYFQTDDSKGGMTGLPNVAQW